MNTDEQCTVDADRLIGYLDAPASDPDLRIHIADCYFCQFRLLQIGGASMTSGAQRRIIRHLFEQLPAFLTADEDEQAEGDRFASLRVHLMLCAECLAEYNEIRTAEEATWADTRPVTSLPGYRPPDLSFLKPTYRWLETDIGPRAVRAIRTLRLDLGLLFQGPALTPMAVRGADEDAREQPSDEVSLGAETLDGLDIQIRLLTEADDPTMASLEVRAVIIDRVEVGFGGTRVILHWPEDWSEHRSEPKQIEEITDDAGIALFAPLPKEELRNAAVDITPGSMTGRADHR